MTRNPAEAQHRGKVHEQLMHALGCGTVHIAVVRQSGEMILGVSEGNRTGGNAPHVFGEVTVRTNDGQTPTIDFQKVKVVGRRWPLALSPTHAAMLSPYGDLASWRHRRPLLSLSDAVGRSFNPGQDTRRLKTRSH